MREALAWMVCLMALCMVTLLSYIFAVQHNRPSGVRPELPAQTGLATEQRTNPAKTKDAGMQSFELHKCQACHSIAGIGNPRYPLDGVGSQLSPQELRDWITGTGVAGEKLPATIRKRKARYLGLGEGEMQQLVQYLSRLKSESAPAP
jgi:hypothetical protein